MKPVYIGFVDCTDTHCCYVVSRSMFPWVASNMEEVLLRRCALKAGSTTLVCEDVRVRRQIMKLVERLLLEDIGNEDRKAERQLILRKQFGHDKEWSGHDIDISEINIFLWNGQKFEISFLKDAIQIDNGTAKVLCQARPAVAAPTPVLMAEQIFLVQQVENRHSWLVRVGSCIIAVNPLSMDLRSKFRPKKIVITSARLATAYDLVRYSLCASELIPIVTTKLIYDELITRIKCLIMDIRTPLLEILFPLEEIVENQFQTVIENSRLRVQYIASFMPTLSVEVHYCERSVLLVGEWYHNPKEFYFAWKERKLEERRYYELVNPSLKSTLCILDATLVSEESNKEMSRLPNIKTFTNQTETQCFVIIDKVLKEELSWEDRMKIVNQVILFRDLLTLEEITAIVADSETETFKPGQLIVRKGMKTEKVYIVCSGEVELSSIQGSQHLKKSSLLCWDSLFLGNKVVDYSATCLNEVTLLSLRRDLCQFVIRAKNLKKVRDIVSTDLPQWQNKDPNNFGSQIQRDLMRSLLIDCPRIELRAGEELAENVTDVWFLLVNGSIEQSFKGLTRNYAGGDLLVIPQKVSQIVQDSTTKAMTASTLLTLDKHLFRLHKCHFGSIFRTLISIPTE